MSPLIRNNVRIFGQGSRTIIFAHSFGCDQKIWRFIVPNFFDDFRVILFDHVGSGRSDHKAWSPSRYSKLDGYTLDLLEVIVELDLKKIIFVGHSVGAMIGALAARAAPHLFSHLILLESSPRYINDINYYGGFSDNDFKAFMRSIDENYINWVIKMVPRLLGADTLPELRDELINNFHSTNPQIARHFTQVAFMVDKRSDLYHIRTPTLILQCSDDFIVPKEVGKYLNRVIFDSKLVVLSTSGHYPNLSAPEETTEQILKFVLG